MNAFILGVLISVVILALGYNTGGYVNRLRMHFATSHELTISLYSCFNCARDFGPRLVAVMAGWGVISSARPMHGGSGALGVQTSAVHYLAH